VLTSIGSCPLATNIAAISFIGRRVGSACRVFLSGVPRSGPLACLPRTGRAPGW
jgi:hypothetical protein